MLIWRRRKPGIDTVSKSQVMDAKRAPRVKVLMVCLGNICRSPSAHGVFNKYIKNNKLDKLIEVDSAGTASYHVGENPDPRSIQAAARRGYSLQQLVARQVKDEDFQLFDYILAMDAANLSELRKRAPQNCRASLGLLLDYADTAQDTVPDPYYSGKDGFELVLDLIEGACEGLLADIRARYLSTASAGEGS